MYELYVCGYVTKNDTLYSHIKQVRAGEVVTLSEREEGDFRVERTRYYRFFYEGMLRLDKTELFRQMDRVLAGVFERLIRSAGGRMLVVPLSGGYDSRVIVSMLKLLGYEKVLCVTYGVPGNVEARMSERVAKEVGYPWRLIPYSSSLWKRWYRSRHRLAFYRYAFNYASLPHIQDVPTVAALKHAEEIPPDAVWIPGHSGDLLGGSQIRKKFRDPLNAGEADLWETVLSWEYSLWPWRNASGLEELFTGRIRECVEGVPLDTPEHVTRAYHLWFWDAKVSRFLVNSMRGYEFYGFEWRLPWWDLEMLDFWGKMPLARTVETVFLHEYLREHFAGRRLFALGNVTVGAYRARKRLLGLPAVYPALRYLLRWYQFFRHPYRWYAWMRIRDFARTMRGPESINSFLVRDLIGEDVLRKAPLDQETLASIERRLTRLLG